MASSEVEDEKTSLTSSSGAPDYDAVFGATSDEKTVKFMQHTVVGELRNPKRFTWAEWVMLVVATPSLLGVLGLSIDRFVYFEKTFYNLTDFNSSEAASCDTWICTTDFTYTTLLLMNLLFCAFYCYDGIFRERPFEMLAYAAGVVVIVLYVIVNYIVNGAEADWVRVFRLVLVVVFGPVNVVMAVVSWKKMGYLIFNVIGSNTELTRAYRCRSFFITLQYFNLQVLVNIFVLAWSRDGQLLSVAEKVIMCLLLVYMFAVIAEGWLAVLYEMKYMAYIWHALMLPCLAYYLYKIIDVSLNWSSYEMKFREFYEGHTRRTEAHVNFIFIAVSLLVACVLGLLVAALLAVFMIIAHWNFGKGLKDKVKPPYPPLVRS